MIWAHTRRNVRVDEKARLHHAMCWPNKVFVKLGPRRLVTGAGAILLLASTTVTLTRNAIVTETGFAETALIGLESEEYHGLVESDGRSGGHVLLGNKVIAILGVALVLDEPLRAVQETFLHGRIGLDQLSRAGRIGALSGAISLLLRLNKNELHVLEARGVFAFFLRDVLSYNTCLDY